MNPHRYQTRSKTRADYDTSSSTSHSVSELLASTPIKTPHKSLAKFNTRRARRSKTRQPTRGSSNKRLAAIEVIHFANEVAQIKAERARKDKLRARPQGLRPPGTVHLTLNNETQELNWAVEIGDFGSKVIFDGKDEMDAKVAGVIFAENHQEDIEGVSPHDLALIPVDDSRDFELYDPKCLMPRRFQGFYFNAQN